MKYSRNALCLKLFSSYHRKILAWADMLWLLAASQHVVIRHKHFQMRSGSSRRAGPTWIPPKWTNTFPAKWLGTIRHLQRTCSPAPCCRWPWRRSTSASEPPPGASCSGWCSLGRRRRAVTELVRDEDGGPSAGEPGGLFFAAGWNPARGCKQRVKSDPQPRIHNWLGGSSARVKD